MENIAQLLRVDSEMKDSISDALDRVVSLAEDHWVAIVGTAVAAYCTNSYYKRWKQVLCEIFLELCKGAVSKIPCCRRK